MGRLKPGTYERVMALAEREARTDYLVDCSCIRAKKPECGPRCSHYDWKSFQPKPCRPCNGLGKVKIRGRIKAVRTAAQKEDR